MLYTHFQSSPHSAGFAFSHCDLMLCWLVAADWLDISSPPALPWHCFASGHISAVPNSLPMQWPYKCCAQFTANAMAFMSNRLDGNAGQGLRHQ